MAVNDYHFITHWHIEASIKEIAEVLADATGLACWWPSVYLDVQQLQPGNEHGVGKVISLYTKGWLPYTLRWQFVVTEVTSTGFKLEATGDFNGTGIWTFDQKSDYVDVVYDWNIRADKPLLRDYSLLMKPIFSANHHWAMRKGEESLKLELARRAAKTPEERSKIPAPPAATPTSPIPLLLSAALIILILVWLVSLAVAGGR